MRETRFKDTEIGRIPEEWEVFDLGSISQIKTGPFGSALHSSDYVVQGTPIITVEHIGGYSIDVSKGVPNVSDMDKKRLTQYSLETGDIVFSRVGSVDRCSYVSECENGWLFSGRLLRVRPKSSIDSRYLTYHLSSSSSRALVRSAAVGLAMPSINTKILNGIKVIIPNSIVEQSRIASALTSIDNLISSLDKLIEKKKNIKQGTMQQLLSGKKRLKGFSTPWVNAILKDHISIGHGRDYKGLKEGSIPVFGTGGYMTSVSKCLYDGPTVCIGRKGTINRPQYHEGPIWTVDTLFFLHSFEGVNPRFLYYLFHTIDWMAMNEATGVPSLTANSIEKLEVILPSIDEQAAIATVLTSMDSGISYLESKKAKYESIKQGMMHHLLTGTIRFTDTI